MCSAKALAIFLHEGVENPADGVARDTAAAELRILYVLDPATHPSLTDVDNAVAGRAGHDFRGDDGITELVTGRGNARTVDTTHRELHRHVHVSKKDPQDPAVGSQDIE